jgi:K+-sensing histidine kinase KdpD
VKNAPQTKAFRYAAVLAVVAAITLVGSRLHINATTVALMFLVAVLLSSAYWGLRYAIVLAIVATASFNFFFLPPIGSFTIADPQNWVALFAFLVTALVASNLAERGRREAEGARQRRREVERLYGLSQRLLASENVLELLNALPRYIQETFSVRSVAVMAADSPTVYRSTHDDAIDEAALRSTEKRPYRAKSPTSPFASASAPWELSASPDISFPMAPSRRSEALLDLPSSVLVLSKLSARTAPCRKTNACDRHSSIPLPMNSALR